MLAGCGHHCGEVEVKLSEGPPSEYAVGVLKQVLMKTVNRLPPLSHLFRQHTLDIGHVQTGVIIKLASVIDELWSELSRNVTQLT